MALDVKVKIDLLKPVPKAGFGFPLIYFENAGEGADKTVPYTVCTSLDDVAAALESAGVSEESELYQAASVMLMQNNPPSKFAILADTASAANYDLINGEHRQIVACNSPANMTKLCAKVEVTNKLLFTSPTYEGFDGTADNKYDRTVFVKGGHIAVAAVVGATAGYEAGEITYKNIVLKGVSDLTGTNPQHAIGHIGIVEKAGDYVTSEGIVASGEYIDIIDSKDWITQQLEFQTQKVLNNMGKVPFDNNGIGLLESAAVNVMRTAYNNGMIATNEDGTPAYAVEYALKSACDAADIAARKYVGGRFAFTLSGAVHNVEITGEISVA